MLAQDIVAIVADLVSIGAIVGAAGWFLYSTEYKRRIQFDVGVNLVPLKGNADYLLAELQFEFENKGFVEHRLWNLNVSVHALSSEAVLSMKDETQEVLFERRLLPKTQIVPKGYGYFFVRPGVRQVLTHTIAIPSNVSAIRITAGFGYSRGSKHPHTIRRIIAVQVAAPDSRDAA